MKISKTQLKKIIKEEISKVLRENSSTRPRLTHLRIWEDSAYEKSDDHPRGEVNREFEDPFKDVVEIFVDNVNIPFLQVLKDPTLEDHPSLVQNRQGDDIIDHGSYLVHKNLAKGLIWKWAENNGIEEDYH